MEVFVLMGSIWVEGDMILGVYASEQEAHDARDLYCLQPNHGFNSFFIDKRELGGAAALQY